MPNTYLKVPIPVSTGWEDFSNPFVRKSNAALCTAYSGKQYSIPAVLLKYLIYQNTYYYRSEIDIPVHYRATRNIGKLPKYLPGNSSYTEIPTGAANTGFYVGRYYILFFQSLLQVQISVFTSIQVQ